MRAVLVHSPATGPSTWRWVAEALTSRGHEVVVPDLREAVTTGDPAAYVRAAAAPVGPDVDAVVGHSGAGSLLPAIATTRQMGSDPLRPVRLVFVDAGLPADGPDPFLGRLRDLAVDGVLPPWSTWFGPGAVAGLVPDLERLAALEAGEPRVPLAFHEAARPAAPLPDDGAYVLLSEAYRSDAERAAGLGWPVVEVPTSHLGLVTHPDAVADAVLQLLS